MGNVHVLQLQVDAETAKALRHFLWRIGYHDVLPLMDDPIDAEAVMIFLDDLRKTLRQEGGEPR